MKVACAISYGSSHLGYQKHTDTGEINHVMKKVREDEITTYVKVMVACEVVSVEKENPRQKKAAAWKERHAVDSKPATVENR